MSLAIRGSCLCGEVTYLYREPVSVFQYCHCSRCRKFTGSAHASNIIVPPQQFQWTSGESCLGRFEHPQAKHFATCFCKKCGSSLPWMTKSGRAVVIPAGTLDDDPGIKPVHNIFWNYRASWREEVADLTCHAELPVKT